jgi:hypothetical protein
MFCCYLYFLIRDKNIIPSIVGAKNLYNFTLFKFHLYQKLFRLKVIIKNRISILLNIKNI